MFAGGMLESYPSLTEKEFKVACFSVEKRCSDRLSGTDWLGIKWTGHELRITQTRVNNWDNELNNIHPSVVETDLEEDIIDAEEDIHSLKRPHTGKVFQVAFSITLSPIYAVPILWFSSEMIKSVDKVYQLLVAQHLQESVRDIGIIGGISQAYHPVSDTPSFFIHPCNTAEGLLAANDGAFLDAEKFLLLWLGLVGSPVGLHIPSKIIADIE